MTTNNLEINNLINNFNPIIFNDETKSFNTLIHPNGQFAIIGFKSAEFLSFVGHAQISTIQGGIECLGYHIYSPLEKLENTNNLSLFDVVSSKTTSLTQLRSIPWEKCEVKQSSNILDVNDEISSFIDQFTTNNESIKEFETIILITANNSSKLEKIQEIDFRFKEILQLSSKHEGLQLVQHFYWISNTNQNYLSCSLPNQWSFSCNEFLEYCKLFENYQVDRVPVVQVVGSKGSGKSTMCRYIVNKLLNHHTKVAYLNTDAGQTELVPSGYITLHLIDSPMLGPNFSQLRAPHSGFYLGDHNVKSNPEYFIKGCQTLIQEFKHLNELKQTGKSSRIPLVVNTHGWVRRMGIEAVVQLTELLNPTHLIQFHSTTTPSSQLPFPLPIDPIQQLEYSLEPVADSTKSDLTDHLETLNNNLNSCRLFLIPTLSELINLTQANRYSFQKYQPVDHRELILYSYFFKHTTQSVWKFNNPISGWTPFSIPFDQLELWHLQDDALDLSQVLFAFNLSLVALYTFKFPEPEKDERFSGIPKYVSPSIALYPPPDLYECVGLGIIKSIDVANRMYHIIAPIHPDVVPTLRAVVKGDLAMPTPLLLDSSVMRTNPNVDKLPYFSVKKLKGYGSSSKRSRTNLVRVSSNPTNNP